MKNERVYIRPLQLSDSESLFELLDRNREFLRPFEPFRPDSYYTLEGQQAEIKNSMSAAEKDQSYVFGIFLIENDKLIGRVALSGVARGPFQNANLSYFLDQQYNGKGYTTEAVSLCLQFAFERIELHRVQAGVMPRNIPSTRVIEKVGFRREGLAEKYLKINGVWEDHVIYAMTVEDFII